MSNERIQELIRYAFFGVCTTLVNIVTYRLLLNVMDYRVSNLIAIIAAKLFAYITNKIFVFRSQCNSKKELVMEMLRFITARGATGLLDYFGLIIAVEVFGFDRVYSKYILQIIVVVLNYILGKKVVFQSNREQKSEE